MKYDFMKNKSKPETKTNFEKYIFQILHNSVFENTMESIRINTDVKFTTTDKRRIYLLSETSYHITKWFSENL